MRRANLIFQGKQGNRMGGGSRWPVAVTKAKRRSDNGRLRWPKQQILPKASRVLSSEHNRAFLSILTSVQKHVEWINDDLEAEN